MNNNLDPEKIRIPAYLRNKAIVRQSKQKLILTALDRKQAGLSVHSQRALAPMKVKEKTYSNVSRKATIRKSRATSFPSRQIPSQQNNVFQRKPFVGDILRNHEHEAPTGFAKIIPVGHITAYIEKIQVAIIKIEKPIRLGDIIQITAPDMLFQQPVDSMQINRKPVKIAKKGSEIGMKVSMEPEINGTVYKVVI